MVYQRIKPVSEKVRVKRIRLAGHCVRHGVNTGLKTKILRCMAGTLRFPHLM